MVKDQGLLGGNLTVCWAAEMEGSQVASLNLGWQRRWTPSCIADSLLSTHLGTISSGGVRLSAVPTTVAGGRRPLERV